MSGDSPEDIKKNIKTYWAVGGILFFFTVVTVAVSTLSLPAAMAILVGLTIASIKGGFVSLIFMHLNHEKKVIYQVLALTAVLFIALLALPVLSSKDQAGRDVAPAAEAVCAEGHEHCFGPGSHGAADDGAEHADVEAHEESSEEAH